MTLSACFLAACALLAPGDPTKIETEHYALEWAGSRAEAEEAAKLLEAAHGELATFFAAEPKERMRFRVFADEKARIEAAWNDGITMPVQSKHASFSEQTKSAYVARLPGPQATRAALLYAACLQFHSLSKSKNIDVGRTWYAWGIALDFARSTWDGTRLVAFAQPRVEPTDLPAAALAAIGTRDPDLVEIAASEWTSPTLSWAVVALCLHGSERSYQKTLQRYALGDTGTKLSTVDFLRHLGPPAKVARDLRAYLVAAQTPFESFGDWEDRGAAGILAHPGADMLAFCVLRAGTERLSARASKLPKAGGKLGFVVGWAGIDDHARVEIEAPEMIVHVVRLGQIVKTSRLPFPGDAARERNIEIERAGNQYTVIVDGSRITGFELPSGRMGFFAGHTDVCFRDVSWR